MMFLVDLSPCTVTAAIFHTEIERMSYSWEIYPVDGVSVNISAF